MNMEENKIYDLKDKDKLTFTGKQLRVWKKKIIEEYKKSEYPATAHRRFRRQGFIEAVDSLKQWIINEGTLDPEPCCHGVRINNIINKLDEWKKQGDKRFVLDDKHLTFIKQMLKEGYSKNQIAKELQVSISTIVYWTNSKFRKRQMERNARRRFGKRLIPIDTKLQFNQSLQELGEK
jgi:hypothetical protein